MALPIRDLRALSDDKLVEWHDSAFGGETETSASFRTELARRDQDRQTATMLRLTRWITIMTRVMTAATVVNIVLFALS